MEHTSPKLLVGALGFGYNGSFCLKHLSCMEIQESFIKPPKRATCERWRAQAPAGFAFSLRAWLLITHGDATPAFARLPEAQRRFPNECGGFRWTAPVRQAYARTVQSAVALGAEAIVFDTPAAFTPTTENRNRLQVFFESIERPAGIALVWQPGGVWAPDEVDVLCQKLELVAAGDPVTSEHWPAGPSAYLKLGKASYRDSDLVALADGVRAYDTSYCIFSGSSANHDARRFKALAGELHDAAGDAAPAGSRMGLLTRK